MPCVGNERSDNPKGDMINCQANYSDSHDKRSGWRLIASVQGNQGRHQHPTITTEDVRQGQGVKEFGICPSKRMMQMGKEDRSQSG